MRTRIKATLVACGAALAVAPQAASATPIHWHGCGDQLPGALQCGEIAVPLDYAAPGAAKIRLGFARLPAQDRAHRVGSLIVNPGGPGGGGSDALVPDATGRHLWHPALHRRFDLIGMDPRGVGTSTPILCDAAPYNQPVPLFPRSEVEFAQLDHWAGALGAGCLAQTGPLLGHVDTHAVARDMEALRRALGDGKLNFLGLSYGADLGKEYAELYPTRIRAMALDGIRDHTSPTMTVFREAGEAYEDSFDRFAAWCGHAAECAWHGRDVGAAFDALVARADRDGLPAPRCEPGACRTPVTGGDIRLNAFGALLTKHPLELLGLPGWRGLGAALAQAERGDASELASHFAGGPRDDPFAGLAVNCADYPRAVDTYADYTAMKELGRRTAPHTQGASEAWLGVLGCMRWPVGGLNPPHRARIHGAPPILLVSATHDPSTSYVWARRVASQIPRAILLTREGDGHTSSWLGSGSRTNSAIARYLITLQTPAPETRLGS